MKLPYDTPVTLLDTHPKELKSVYYYKGPYIPMFIEAQFTITKKLEPTYMPIHAWLDKENVTYIHNVILFRCTEENYSIFRKMDVTRDYCIKQNKWDLES